MNPDVGLDTALDQVLDPELATRIAAAFGYVTVDDLLGHLPRRYRALGQRRDRQDFVEGERVTVVGDVLTAATRPMRQRKGSLLSLTVDDGGDSSLDVTFFRSGGLSRILTPGSRVMFDGTVKRYRGRVGLAHPEFLVLVASDPARRRTLEGSGNLAGLAHLSAAMDRSGLPSLFERPILPIYRATRDVSSWDLFGAIVTALRALRPVVDPIDQTLRTAADVVDIDTALRCAHLPDTESDHQQAWRRLRFDEALLLQLYLGRRRRSQTREPAPPCPPRTGGALDALCARLPFELTAGQQAVRQQILTDLASASPMNRLLQGEVGSGKTILSLLAMMQVVDSGRQCVLLAPTEVLAAQHQRSLAALLGPLAAGRTLGADEHAITVTLLTGSMSTARRRTALLDIVTGEAGIVIGTHAVIQDSVEFFDLGLVVVDEQHRFGVRQRDRLRGKGRSGVVPHLLVMTATPIPRTIAMTVFGDLEVSELRELPAGRKEIASTVVPVDQKPRWLDRTWQRVREEVLEGHRVYIVCSRIGGEATDEATGEAIDWATDTARDGVTSDVVETPRVQDRGVPVPVPVPSDQPERPPTHAAEELHAFLSAGVLAGLRVGLVHGRLPADEKDQAMTDFAAGDLDVLVATTVIEVGVDVPEATMMVIMDAERFGISQLHQLRGRIGRGGLPGLCLMVSAMPVGSPSLERLQQIASTTDGFALAQIDLEQRREGNVLGDEQSGALSHLKVLSVVDDVEIIDLAHSRAEALLESDPGLGRHPGLAAQVDRLAASVEVTYLDRS